MSTRLANSSKDKQKEALEHSFVSALETITDLPEDEVRRLAEKFRDKTATAIRRREETNAEIKIRPENQARIVFEIQEKNCTRSVREIVEDYLDKRDRSGEWNIKRKEKKGSRLTVVATRSRATGSRSVADKGTASSSSEEPEEDVKELKDKLSDLDSSEKEAIADLLG